MAVTLAVDAMSGDVGVGVTVPASARFLRDFPDAHLILVGHQDILYQAIKQEGLLPSSRLTIHHASEVVNMDELPQLALRNKKNSSMRLAIDLVKSDQAKAAISCGNTGALMATAHFVLKMLPDIHRPAIAKLIPWQRGVTCVLDLGANIDATPDQLLDFGVMGSALISVTEKIKEPKVGLLNIGTESSKGSEVIQQAHLLMQGSNLNYQGYVEGHDLFSGAVHVVVTDGFTGNVALKTSEGLAKMVASVLRDELSKTLWHRLSALLALPALKNFKTRLDARRYNGASLLGLQGIVIKSHGGTDKMGFYFALSQAFAEAQEDIIKHIASHTKARISSENKTFSLT